MKFTLREFISKAKAVHGDKYDYSQTVYTNMKTKLAVICRVHGVFEQLPTNHIYGGFNCPKCAPSAKQNIEIFIKRAKLVHGDKYDYSRTIYHGADSDLVINCLIHGEFTQRAIGHLNGSGCHKCALIRSDTKSFIEKARLIHGEKYNYSKTDYKKTREKIIIICPTHGEFLQKPMEHLKGFGCIDCGGSKLLTTDKFIQKAKSIHGEKYDYSKADYKNTKTKITIICPIHGEFTQRPHAHLSSKDGCPVCKEPLGEKAIRVYLENNNIQFEKEKTFIHCISQKGFKLRYDFYLSDLNILIEFHGQQHYDSNWKWSNKDRLIESRNNDKLKEIFAEKEKIKLVIIPYTKIKQIGTILSDNIK